MDKLLIKKKLVWAGGALVTFIVFYFLIPLSIYNFSEFFFSIVGGIILTFFSIQVLADFKSWDEFNNTKKEEQDWRHKYTPFMIIPGIALALIFIVHFQEREKADLKENGVIVKGLIVDGRSSENLKGNGSYNVTVQFYTKEGELRTIQESVGKNEFNSFSKGQQVDLVYSKNDPSMIELLTKDTFVESNTGIKGRHLNMEDLDKIISLDGLQKDKVGDYLNSISYKWEMKKDSEERVLWVNSKKNEVVIIYPFKQVSFISSNYDDMVTFPKSLVQLGYYKIRGNSKSSNFQVFEKGDKRVLIKREIMGKTFANVVTLVSAN